MEIVFTHILTSGKYQQVGRKIRVTLDHGIDSPQHFTFTIISTEKLVLDLDQSAWLLTE